MPEEQSPPTTIYYDTLRNIPVPIQALCEAGLSATQWTMLFLMHHKELRPELLAMIHCENKPLLWTNEDLQDLLDRFYLIREPHPGAASKTDLANFRVSERFTDLLGTLKEAWLPAGHYELARPRTALDLPSVEGTSRRLAKETGYRPAPPCVAHDAASSKLEDLEAFDELFQAYPSHIPVNGTLMSGRGGDYDAMAATYAKTLGSKLSPGHDATLELVRWAREQNLLTMGLKKFLDSREWLGLQELRDQGFSGSTFDSQTAI